MKHLEDEDIARMIDGKINKRERECFLEHLAGCDTCLTIYNESLNFVEQEGKVKKKSFLKMPDPGRIADRFWQPVKSIFASTRLIPAYAVLLIGIILIPFLLFKEDARVNYIEESITALTVRGSHNFAGANEPEYAAIRAGIFMEELSLIVDRNSKEDLKGKLTTRLIDELKVIFNGEADSLFAGVNNLELEAKTFAAFEQGTRDMLARHSHVELFQFGEFLEQSILGSFEHKVPHRDEVEKYRQLILRKYKDKLPEGLLKELDKFTGAVQFKESREIFQNIKDIFLAFQ